MTCRRQSKHRLLFPHEARVQSTDFSRAFLQREDTFNLLVAKPASLSAKILTFRERAAINRRSKTITKTQYRMSFALLGLLVSVVPIVAFWLSWGVTKGGGRIEFGAGTYTFEIQHTGKDAGPYGYLTLAIGSLSFILWLGSILAKKSRGLLGGQVLLSLFGGVFVLFAVLSHPAIGWPLGPSLAIAGFVGSALIAAISFLIPVIESTENGAG